MPTVRYCSLYLIALISALFPAPGYTFELIPAWFKSERARKTVWELRDQYVRLVNQDTLHGKPPAPNDHPAELSSSELRQVLRAISVWASQVFYQEVDRRLYPIKTGGRESGEAHVWRIVSAKGQSQIGRGDARRLAGHRSAHDVGRAA